ncbi:shikimate dehydrogenase [Marmoricola sp. RAF53]|uniref:shikimate dehydrogenase n=1 Tax=Marmoricola sp. RAF53 TaxID=3233059 RepID=UPI003F9BBF22
MAVTGRRCAVLGSPIAHSLSPVLHRAAYAARGLDWSYEAVEVTEDGLADFVAGLDGTWRGLSLTMPLKRAVLPLLTDLDPWAAVSGAANTVVLDGDHRVGHNTDVPGAVAALTERSSGPWTEAVVLGGGATAASVLLALAELGTHRARLLVRNPDRAAETLAAVHRHAPQLPVTVGLLGEPATGDVLVSTVPADAQTPELLATVTAPVVFEVLYDPWPTPLVTEARRRGATVVGGLDLLVHQAALQVALMTGAPGPLAAMRAAGEAALLDGTR